jgi:hypothetical protein
MASTRIAAAFCQWSGCSSLRVAMSTALGDAALVNSAMEAEIAALRANDDARRVEIDEILARLEPLIEERAHA